jgi:hypothetical protein
MCAPAWSSLFLCLDPHLLRHALYPTHPRTRTQFRRRLEADSAMQTRRQTVPRSGQVHKPAGSAAPPMTGRRRRVPAPALLLPQERGSSAASSTWPAVHCEQAVSAHTLSPARPSTAPAVQLIRLTVAQPRFGAWRQASVRVREANKHFIGPSAAKAPHRLLWCAHGVRACAAAPARRRS